MSSFTFGAEFRQDYKHQQFGVPPERSEGAYDWFCLLESLDIHDFSQVEAW